MSNYTASDSVNLICDGLTAISKGVTGSNTGIQTCAAGIMLACRLGVTVHGKRDSDVTALSMERLVALGNVIRARAKHNDTTRATMRALNNLIRNASDKRAHDVIDNTAIKRVTDFAAVAAAMGLTHLDFSDTRHAFKLSTPFMAIALPSGASNAEIIGNKREREGPHFLDYRTSVTYEYTLNNDTHRASARLSVAGFMRANIAHNKKSTKRDKKERETANASAINTLDSALSYVHSHLARADYAPSGGVREAFLDLVEAYAAASPENRAAVLNALTKTENADSTHKTKPEKRKAA